MLVESKTGMSTTVSLILRAQVREFLNSRTPIISLVATWYRAKNQNIIPLQYHMLIAVPSPGH